VIRLVLGLAAVFLFSVCQTAFAWSPEDMLATASYPTHSCLQSFYVSTTGQDDNSGASEAEPLRTITRAASMASPGDCVVVMPGIYQERVVISHGGNADSSTGYLTILSKVPHEAKIVPDRTTYSTFVLGSGANYVVVQGFDIQGGTKEGVAGGGHAIDAGYGTHHDKFLSNIVHDSGGGGISAAYGDYYTIVGNIAFNNASTSKFQASGIGVYQARAISDGAPGFHIVVSGNISYHNQEHDIDGGGTHTDGNGIIIDDFHNSQNGSKAGNYPYETLVQNNLVFGNGGKGIQLFLSDNITVINNTSYFNNRDPLNTSRWRGELNNQVSSNNKWINNIGVSDRTENASNSAIGDESCCGYVASGTVWKNNLTFNGSIGAASVLIEQTTSRILADNGNKLGIDPQFRRPSLDPARANFRLGPTSPAIAAGIFTAQAIGIDLDGNMRSPDSVDIGAYAYRK